MKENLENKIIVEFPTFHVVMKDHSNIYEIIDTGKYYPLQLYRYITDQIRICTYVYYYLDEEETSDTECASYVVRKRCNNDNRSNKKNEPVNYFFNDFSGSDDEKTDPKLKKRKQSLDIPNYEDLIKM